MEIVFLLILAVILYSIFKNKPKTTNTPYLNKTKTPVLKSTQTQQNTTYTKKEVFRYDLKGIFYNNYKVQGEFLGYARTTYNSHDKYCVGIYINEQLAGYPPKGNFRLYNYLNNNNNNLLCWGYIGHDNFQNQYFGNVFIPINFSDEEIKNLTKAFDLIKIQNNLFTKENKSISEYFSILENDIEIEKLLHPQKTRDTINYNFHLTVIPELSKKLEELKDWKNLIYLDNFQNQINRLSEKYKNSTLKRIEKAKSISNTKTN